MSSFENLNVYSGKKQLLHNVSGTLVPRSMMLLGGPSGAGKTVFLNALTGRHGNLRVDGKVDIQPHEFVYVRTHTEYYTRTFTVLEEVEFSARMFSCGPVQIEQVNAVIDSVGMTEFKDKYICELSSGQRKRLSIACALTKPNVRCLILDEPTSNLDSSAAVAIIEAIHNTIRRMVDVSVICSVHQPSSLILSYFDTTLLLCRGHCVYQGPMGEEMYTSLRQYSSTCVDYESVQFALSQDPTDTTSLYSQWNERVTQSIVSGKTPKRQTLRTQVMSSIRGSIRLHFQKTSNTSIHGYLFQLQQIIRRTAKLFIKDWRREIARIVLIYLGFIVGAVLNGRPTFTQAELLSVVATTRGVAYYQGMTGISRVINRHESDKIVKDCIDNGMFTRGQYEMVMFMNIVVAAILTSFVTAVVCAWMYAPFTFEIWIVYVFYFCYVDTMFSLNMIASDSIIVAAIGTLTILLICFASPIDSVIVPVTELFRYTQSAIMSDITWEACKPNNPCYGGSDGCVVLDVVTFSKCDQPVTSTLLCSAVWTILQLIATRFIRIK
jgi:ABC-type multidrug transport system ATPase subunit